MEVPGRVGQVELDLTVSAGVSDPISVLERGWAEQSAGVIPLPPVEFARAAADYRIRIRHAEVTDAVIEDLYSEAIVGFTGGHFRHHEELVVVHIPATGGWDFEGRRVAFAVAPGELCVRSNDRPWQFGIAPATRTDVLTLPAQEFRPLIDEEPFVGPRNTAEARLLTSYMTLVTKDLDDATDAGLRHARHALVELLKGLLTRRNVAVGEPALQIALAEAARQLAESRLLDPDLTPGLLARLLNVSVRSLYRAFVDAEESVMGFIRRRRLERACDELVRGGMPLSELAARWHFTDGSHFTRTFKSRYGMAPSEYRRWHRRTVSGAGRE
ncbi:helix-turn-helix domain-containing protein [Promicromonospora sp. NPDC019610]|uniref:helix-turn-helix domain-containing protein n=1 Tax=Promicromonospora sp. NPDC019610 TaxID=3364405 RepID=UPI0037906916